MSAHRKDISNKRFGRLMAIAAIGKIGRSHTLYWLCQCDCGAKIAVDGSRLRKGINRRVAVACG